MGSRMYQDSITIEGGHPLYGEVRIHGAKNAVLPVLSASLLLPETILHQCPDLTDVTAACRILSHLGCGVKREGETLLLSAETVRNAVIPPILAGGMRGSVIFLGAMLSRFGSAEIALPGGCRLGARPVDIHLSGLEQMGALICEENGWLCCSAPNGLHGAKISLRYPSVGATENLLIAAALARGETVLYGAAMEPEIWDALLDLRAFMFARVYSRDWANNECQKTHHIITELVGYYMAHPGQMPNEYLEIAYREGTQRGVCDFVACMTDAYAVKTYQKLFIPPFFDGID